jgi:NAD(P)-dependent dehydrogenase (short-subunit alcohol dehydrogenase family)
MSKVVLITGCSTGIGCDLANKLAQSGYTVVATARNVESMEGLEVALKLPLDVTNSESIQKAMEAAKPNARYLAGVPISRRLVLHLGDSVWNFVVKHLYKITTQE